MAGLPVRSDDMANQQKGQDQNLSRTQQQATRQQSTGQQKIDKDVQNAGRERNTLGQTEQQASYWRDQYRSEPYATKGQSYEEYSPAYRTGYEGRSQYAG